MVGTQARDVTVTRTKLDLLASAALRRRDTPSCSIAPLCTAEADQCLQKQQVGARPTAADNASPTTAERQTQYTPQITRQISSEQPDQLNNSTVQIAEKCANRQYSCRSKSKIAPTICKGGYKNSNDYKSRYKIPSSMMHSYIANKVQDLNAYQFSITKLDSASRHLPAIRLIGGYPASRKPTLRTHYQLDKTRKTETSSREPFTVRSATKVTSD